MAAILVEAPIPAPRLNIETWREDEEAYTTRLRELALKHRETERDPHKLIGEIVRWQRADGYASYMVWRLTPHLQLVHLNLGDAYTVEPSLLRGLTKDDVRQMVEWERSWTRATTEPNESFYTKDRIGQIVHYHNGFGQFVRCEVVAAEYINRSGHGKTIGGVALKPIALVGNIKRFGRNNQLIGPRHGWFGWDIVRRFPDGTVHHGYHAKMVLVGELFQPHASNIVESPSYSAHEAWRELDPASMKPISLDPPPMTAEEKRMAPLAQAHRKIAEIVREQPHPATPEAYDLVLTEVLDIVLEARTGREITTR